jgi:hypothetical protein
MCLNACSAEIALGPPKARRSADLRLSRTKILLGPAPLGPVKSVTCGVSDQATIELRPILNRRALFGAGSSAVAEHFRFASRLASSRRRCHTAV